MKYLNKIPAFLFAALLGTSMLTLTGCEGGDLYSVGAPDWIEATIDSIASVKPARTLQYTWGSVDDSYLKSKSNEMTLYNGQTLNYEFDQTTAGVSNWQGWVLCVDVDGVQSVKLRGDNWENLAGSNAGCESDFVWDTFPQEMNGSTHKMKVVYADGTLMMYDEITASSGTEYHYSYTKDGYSAESITVYLQNEAAEEKMYQEEITGTAQIVPDMQPVSMVLNHVPETMEKGQTLEEGLKGMTATVTYEGDEGRTAVQDVELADLTVTSMPDISTLGEKQLIVAYSKTSKGNGATKPVIATAKFTVVKVYPVNFVTPTPAVVGAEDFSTGWWTAFSNDIKIENETKTVFSFTNYSDAAANWHNAVVILRKADLTEYAVVRMDNYGWGTGYSACSPTCNWNWDTFTSVMNGAKVTVTITNTGLNTANIDMAVVGSDGNNYEQHYTGINGIDPEDLYFAVTVENACLKFDTAAGAKKNAMRK